MSREPYQLRPSDLIPAGVGYANYLLRVKEYSEERESRLEPMETIGITARTVTLLAYNAVPVVIAGIQAWHGLQGFLHQ